MFRQGGGMFRRPLAQVRLVGQIRGASSSPLGKAAFGQGLDAPGDALAQVGGVVGAARLSEYLLILIPQGGGLHAFQSDNPRFNGFIHGKCSSVQVFCCEHRGVFPQE